MVKPIAIIGVGNLLMSDEGVGVHAIAELEKHGWPEDVELIDAAVPGLSLLYIIEGRSIVVIIDCADFGGAPGEARTFDADQLVHEETRVVGLHAQDVMATLALAKKLGKYPKKVVIIGIQPEKVEMGTTLSPSCVKTLKGIKKIINDLL